MSSPVTIPSSAGAVGNSDRAVPAGGAAPVVGATAGAPHLNTIPFKPEVEVSFACPECEHTCQVLWEYLALGIECPACNSSFHILPDRLEKRAQAGPAEITFHCPRCRQLNCILAARAAQGATCSGCQLELLPGPDKKLHDREELKIMKAQVRQQRSHPSAATIIGFDPDKFRLMLLAAAGLVGLMAVIWSAAWLLHTPTLPELATDFTRTCLEDKRAALAFVAEEDYQQKEFERWWIMHFSSLSVAVKNSKDWPAVAVTVVKDEPAQQTLRVVMSSSIIGQRSLTQIWLRDEANSTWRFDSVGTLNNLHAAD